MPKKYTDTQKKKVLELYDNIGKPNSNFGTLEQMIKENGIIKSKDTLYRWLSERELEREKERERELEQERVIKEFVEIDIEREQEIDELNELRCEIDSLRAKLQRRDNKIEILEQEIDELNEKLDFGQTIKLGNTFWMFLASNLGVKSRDSMKHLKLKISEKILSEIGVDTTKTLKKFQISDDFFE